MSEHTTSTRHEIVTFGYAAVEAQRPTPRLLVLRLLGEIDLTNSEQVGRWISANAAPRTVVDLDSLSFISVGGVHELARAQHRLADGGSELFLVAPTNPLLHTVVSSVGRFTYLRREHVAALG